MFTKASIIALFASVAAAQHAAVGSPSGNAITRPLNEVVPACKPFTITWEPTTTNTVSLILLRGPSTNVLPLSTLVVGIPNSGTFTWTPASSLEADTTHYGLQLIDDVNGQYQYSTQFGISKDGCVASSSAVVAPSSSAAVVASSAAAPAASSADSGYGAGSPAATTSMVAYPVAAVSSLAAVSSVAVPAVSVVVPVASSVAVPPYPSKPATTGQPYANSTMAYAPSGTGAYTKPSGTAEFTGAASALNAGGLVAAVGVLAAFFL